MSNSGDFELDVDVAPDPVDGGFIARVRQFPGAMSQGDSEEEASDNAMDAFFCLMSATLNVGVDFAPDDKHAARTHSVAELV